MVAAHASGASKPCPDSGCQGFYCRLAMPLSLAGALAAVVLLPPTVLTAVEPTVLVASRPVRAVVLAFLAIGAGVGGLGIPQLTLLGDLTPKHLYGRAFSIYQWSGDLGGALGSITGLGAARALGYGAVYGAGPAILLAVIPLAMHIRRKLRRRHRIAVPSALEGAERKDHG